MSKQSILVLAMVALSMLGMAEAGLVGYVGTGKDVYWTNFESGQQTQLALNGLSIQVDYFESFAMSRVDGYLYAVGHWSSPLNVGGRTIERSLYKIDPSSGNVTNNVAFLSGSHGLQHLPALAIASDNTPYAIELRAAGDLYALVPPPGNTDPYIGVTHIGQAIPLLALAIDGSNNGIAWSGPPSYQKLYWLDLSDASTTEIGDLSGDFSSLHYAPDGTLYAWGNKTLYEIDVGGLTATSLGSFSYGDSPFAILPEPSTLLLLGLGAVTLRRKRRYWL